MSLELTVLAAAVLWGFLQIVLAAQAANWQHGLRWGASPRDEPMPPLAAIPGRCARNLQNYLESFPFFAAAVLLSDATDTHNAWTEWARLPISAAVSSTRRSMSRVCQWRGRWPGTSPRSGCSPCWPGHSSPDNERCARHLGRLSAAACPAQAIADVIVATIAGGGRPFRCRPPPGRRRASGRLTSWCRSPYAAARHPSWPRPRPRRRSASSSAGSGSAPPDRARRSTHPPWRRTAPPAASRPRHRPA